MTLLSLGKSVELDHCWRKKNTDILVGWQTNTTVWQYDVTLLEIYEGPKMFSLHDHSLMLMCTHCCEPFCTHWRGNCNLSWTYHHCDVNIISALILDIIVRARATPWIQQCNNLMSRGQLRGRRALGVSRPAEQKCTVRRSGGRDWRYMPAIFSMLHRVAA